MVQRFRVCSRATSPLFFEDIRYPKDLKKWWYLCFWSLLPHRLCESDVAAIRQRRNDKSAHVANVFLGHCGLLAK